MIAIAQPKRALSGVIGAQFFTSLADNALLIAAIGLLAERHAAGWATPALRMFFYASYVLLAPFAGTVADAFPKGRVMLATNLCKLAGCALLVGGAHPLLAYAAIGAGAAAHAPARYGILTELVATRALVAANAWMEAATVAAILLGAALGAFLMASGAPTAQLFATPARSASAVIAALYLFAVACAAAIPGTGAPRPAPAGARAQLNSFGRGFALLWRDPRAQVSLAVTSLFWAVSAVLQFLILEWAQQVLGLQLSQAALLQAVVAVGMVAGALAAGRLVPTRSALALLPLGLALALGVLLMAFVTDLRMACALLFAVGVVSGLFLVPMNALLQYRGAALMRPGASIAIQNFNENTASLAVLAGYGALVYVGAQLRPILVCCSGAIALTMAAILMRQRANQRRPVAARHTPGSAMPAQSIEETY